MRTGTRTTTWTDADRETLRTWFPHFGGTPVAEMLQRPPSAVRGYATYLKLHMLPKAERLCLLCRERFQSERRYGLLCAECHSTHRKVKRAKNPMSRAQWIRTCLNSIRYRAQGPMDLTLEYLEELWTNQGGRCFYSGIPIQFPSTYGRGRSLFSPSVDRVDATKGYTQGNVVWAAWACNVGKYMFTPQEYLEVCQKVAAHLPGIIQR